MEFLSRNDLWLVIFLSLIGLALIWLSPLMSYPFNLLPYLLILFLPGYALVTAIKPYNSLTTRIILGFLLSLLFLFFLVIAFNNLNEPSAILLFFLAIFFSIIAIIRRHRALKGRERQLTLDESIKRVNGIKKESEEEAVLSDEMEEYTPMPAEVEEPPQKDKMSVMRLIDTGERSKADKSQKEEKITDKKPIRDEILRRKQEEKSGGRTIPLAVEHPVKRDDLLSAFQKEMGRPVWLDAMNDDKSGFRNWDLLLALLLSGLAVSFSYYDPLRTPLLTTIASYAMLLFILTYTFLVVMVPDKRRIGLLYRILTSSVITILLLVLVLFFGNSNIITSLPLPLILLLALATLLLVIMAILRRRSLPPESAELSLEEIIKRAEKLEILVEHDEETLRALKELEKETEEEPPKEEKPPEEEKKPPKEEIPVIIVEHDEEDEREWETETIIVDHEDEEETEQTPIIIVEHDEEKQDVEEQPAKEVEKEEPSPDKDEPKPSLLATGAVTKVDKDLAYPAEEESEPKKSAKEKTETESKIPPKQEVKTETEPPIKEEKKEKVEKKRHPVKNQFNYADLVLVPLFACLLLIYFIIPLFPKTPLTVMAGTSLLFILAGYSLVVSLYPKKFDAKRLVTGILIGILLYAAYQIALFLNYLTFFSESISLWLLIFILIFCLITYFRRGRAVPSEEILQPKKDFEKPNIVNLFNEVVREREEKEKVEPVPKEEDPFLALRSRTEPVKADSGKSIKKHGQPEHGRFMNFFRGLKSSFQGESRTQVVLSVILIIALVIAISATAYIIIKPKPGVTFTEFYILGPDGKSSNYPINLTAGQQGKVIIGVVNHEYAAISYQLVVKMNNNIIQSQTISLQNNAKKEIPFTFTASPPGQGKMEFLLYKLPDNQKVYRSLHL
jgi:uncharacterized membrane protein